MVRRPRRGPRSRRAAGVANGAIGSSRRSSESSEAGPPEISKPRRTGSTLDMVYVVREDFPGADRGATASRATIPEDYMRLRFLAQFERTTFEAEDLRAVGDTVSSPPGAARHGDHKRESKPSSALLHALHIPGREGRSAWRAVLHERGRPRGRRAAGASVSLLDQLDSIAVRSPQESHGPAAASRVCASSRSKNHSSLVMRPSRMVASALDSLCVSTPLLAPTM